MSPDLPVAPMSIAELRHARQMLKHERDHIIYWRRLLRARMDLALSAIMLPEELGFNAWGVLPDAAVAQAPPWQELVNAVHSEPSPQLSELDECRNLAERLATYEGLINAELHRVTNQLVDLLSQESSLGLDFA